MIDNDLQVKYAYSVLRHYNSCKATQTILSSSVLETVLIREINLWNVTEAGARTGHL